MLGLAVPPRCMEKLPLELSGLEARLARLGVEFKVAGFGSSAA